MLRFWSHSQLSAMSAMTGPQAFAFACLFPLLPLLAALLPTASSAGIVNGYCNGWNANLSCSLDNLLATTSIINSLAISSYHLSDDGLVIPCAKGSPDCAFPMDVEQYNARVVREVPGMLVVPLVFDNDGKTVAQTRAMWSNGYADTNIATLVNRTLAFNYSGLSMDWEPSCWMKKPSQCNWPTVEEAQQYTGFLTKLSSAFVAVDRVLTVCADHEECEPDVDCGGDDYIQHCAADEYSMSWCNCCAFHTWSATHPLQRPLHRLHEQGLSTHCAWLCWLVAVVAVSRFNATALCAIPTMPNIAVMVRAVADPHTVHSPLALSHHSASAHCGRCVVCAVSLCRTRTATTIRSMQPT